MDTIYAEATPPGRGGISVVRLSGPEARAIGEDLAGPLPEARRAELRELRDGELIDRALVLRFDAGRSFTGEAVVEFHLHGAPVVVRRLGEALQVRGARPAEAGEFTRRGFLNGQIPLSDAEGLADLLAAETEAQRRQAMRAVGGELARWSDDLRRKLVRAGALVEASLDFADEEVPEEVPAEVFALLRLVRAEMESALAGHPAAERVRAGFEVAIMGPPNAGKSSLLNRIGRRDVALVSEVAGTTRDVIELRTEIGGLAVTFLDTAGLRETADPVERMGIARARARAAGADLRIHLIERSAGPEAVQPGDIILRSKSDLGEGDVSATTGAGVDGLLEQIRARLAKRVAGAGPVTRARQADCLGYAIRTLDVGPDTPPELLAEAIRDAAARLHEMIGKLGAEDYLDEIFSSFCIGK